MNESQLRLSGVYNYTETGRRRQVYQTSPHPEQIVPSDPVLKAKAFTPTQILNQAERARIQVLVESMIG